jgi:hypothetical protein
MFIKTKKENEYVVLKLNENKKITIKYKGTIRVKQVENHVEQPKNYQNFQTYLCNAILISCRSRKIVLNDVHVLDFFLKII